MKREVGLWIDHKKAVLFTISDEGANLKRITSNVEEQAVTSEQTKEISAGAHVKNKGSLEQQDTYFNAVIAYVQDAVSILIFGPGEAKTELKKRLVNKDLEGKIVGFESATVMTDSQIVAKVRNRFLK